MCVNAPGLRRLYSSLRHNCDDEQGILKFFFLNADFTSLVCHNFVLVDQWYNPKQKWRYIHSILRSSWELKWQCAGCFLPKWFMGKHDQSAHVELVKKVARLFWLWAVDIKSLAFKIHRNMPLCWVFISWIWRFCSLTHIKRQYCWRSLYINLNKNTVFCLSLKQNLVEFD